MKALILSCNTGGGHNAAGRAIEQKLKQMGHQAVMLDYLRLAGDKVSNAVGGVYVSVVKKTQLKLSFSLIVTFVYSSLSEDLLSTTIVSLSAFTSFFTPSCNL